MPVVPAATEVRRALMRWYRGHGRHELPWRSTRDPYAILVSEVMLQQTQVQRVLPRYQRWLELWPDAAALAAATPADVIREWGGLGYNRRAIHLHHAAARLVAKDPRALWVSELLNLPGVGPYTAAAIVCFASNQRLAVLDTNVARVMARLVVGVENARQARPAAIRYAAEALLPARGARDHNLALMDLGAMVCTARNPACGECPIRKQCAWLAAGHPPGSVPVNRKAPFPATARFARGRIVAALRASPSLTAPELAELLSASHQPMTGDYLRALQREGLVREDSGRWSLPGAAHGSTSIASPKL